MDTARGRIRNSGNRLATTNRRDFRGLQRALHARMRWLHARNNGERVVRLGLTRGGLPSKVLREIQRPVFSLLEGCALRDPVHLSYDRVREIGELKHLDHLTKGVLAEYEE